MNRREFLKLTGMGAMTIFLSVGNQRLFSRVI